VIFATCGSSHFPFTRMMEALQSLPPERLYVQHGPAEPPPGVQAEAYIPFGGVIEKLEQADIVVSHAGVGSIICALRAGHVPIIFPRLERYGETVDDHQAELAEALSKRGNVRVAWTGEELIEAVASMPARSAAPLVGGEMLGAAVRAAIRGETHAPRRWRRHAAVA
jgi:UDP-N-acetylglucosamine--N-acetylmuramyl-(pentapeptide) pyrophosphoryl-undecaprenol N-acetylglucosamine transferase